MATRVSMFSILLIFSVVALSFAYDGDGADSSKEFVLTLDQSNFSDTVSKHDFIVVELYAPWCGHCKKLAPEYENAASLWSIDDPHIALAKVDASDELNKELASDYEVRGFPRLKILRNGGKAVQDYKGPCDADGIVAYLKKQSGLASAEIKSAEDATIIIDEEKVVILWQKSCELTTSLVILWMPSCFHEVNHQWNSLQFG